MNSSPEHVESKRLRPYRFRRIKTVDLHIRARGWRHEIRPGCLKVAAHAESKLLADALAKRLGDD
jgi:hypothetical protein